MVNCASHIHQAYCTQHAHNLYSALLFLASQMWCLARMLPLMLADIMTEDFNDNWQNFLCLLKIEEIVFAPSCTTELAAYLVVLVEEYLEQFTKLYDQRVIPKQHYMVHYARQIVRYKP